MADILARHRIEMRLARQDRDRETARMRYFVPADNPSIASPARSSRIALWDDNTFYDVSAWSLAHSFDVPVDVITRSELQSLRIRDPRPQGRPWRRGRCAHRPSG